MSAFTTQAVFRLETVKFRQKNLIWKHFEGLGDGTRSPDRYENESSGCRHNSSGFSKGNININNISCIPFVVEFRRLLTTTSPLDEVSRTGLRRPTARPSPSNSQAIPGISNNELLHAVIGLYDICLPEITPEVLYQTVCGKHVKTIVLVRETAEIIDELMENARPELNVCEEEQTVQKSITKIRPSDVEDCTCDSIGELKSTQKHDVTDDDYITNDVNVAYNKEFDSGDSLETVDKQGIFVDVFSDTDGDTDDEEGHSNSSDEEDFSKGLKTFLKLVQERRKQRMHACSKGRGITRECVGIESQIVGCATWKKSHIVPGEKIVQIELMGVRRKFRKWGIGKYLIQVLKDTLVVGSYDTLVVYADSGAVNFFEAFGFKDDIVLNSKYEKLVDNWTNSTLMCFLPPFTDPTLMHSGDDWLDIKAMELEFEKLTKKSRDFYQTQYQCMERLKHEVISLRTLVKSQANLIKSLRFDKESLQKKYYELEKSCLLLKMRALKSGVDLQPDHFNIQ